MYQNCIVIHVGAIYFMLGNLDPALRSRLDTINLVALFRTELLQQYSFDVIIQPFITDLKKLFTVSLLPNELHNYVYMHLMFIFKAWWLYHDHTGLFLWY